MLVPHDPSGLPNLEQRPPEVLSSFPSLPYQATTTDLLTHFSFIGPVKHGFVATDRATGKSKGVGYVTFSLPEDADRAVQELDGGDFAGNRKIRVQRAERKVCFMPHRPFCQ